MPSTREIGSDGETLYLGAGSANVPTYNDYSLREHLDALRWPQGNIIYDRMVQSDHQISAVLRAISLPIRQGRWTIEPDKDADAKGVDAAEKISEWLMGPEAMETSWDDAVDWSLSRLIYGHSVLEQVWHVLDGYQRPRYIDLRPARTLVGEMRDRHGVLTHIIQQTATGEEVDIPVDSLVMFNVQSQGRRDWRGTSLLRACYKAWLIKDDLERVAHIMYSRWGSGTIKIQMAEGVVKGSQEWKDAEEAGRKLHADEQGYLTIPFGTDVGVLEKQFQTADPLAYIKHSDQNIARALLAQHIQMGQGDPGSRALGQTFVNAFLQAILTWAQGTAWGYRRQVVVPLTRANWGPDVKPPVVKVTDIHDSALAELGYLMQAGVILPGKNLEKWVREGIGAPEDETTTQPPASGGE